MKNGRELLLGIDLCDGYSQICYYDTAKQEPETIIFDSKNMILKNPVTLKEIFNNDHGLSVKKDELIKLISFLIESAKQFSKCAEVDSICVTLEEFTITYLDALRDVFETLGYTSDRVHFISHDESCAYYAFSMKKELWNGGIVLLDYSKKGIIAYRLYNAKIKTYDMILEQLYEYTDMKLRRIFEKKMPLKDIDAELEQIVKEVTDGKIISSIYLTGPGFDTTELPEKFLKILCNRRRVFSGQNLYVKGACYAAFEEKYGTRFQGTLFACKNRVVTGIEMGISERGQDKMFRIVKQGTNWYQAGRTVDFILDECREIKLIITPVGKNPYEEIISLEEFPDRANKTTKISMEVLFTSENRCMITVKDKGFGEFARSSEQIVYRNLEI